MNRRDFLKRLGSAGLVVATADIIVPERRFWQLDNRMMMPARLPGDDTAWVQWHLDHLVQVPSGRYDMHAPTVFRNMEPGKYEPFEPGCAFTVHTDIAVKLDASLDGVHIDGKGARWDFHPHLRSRLEQTGPAALYYDISESGTAYQLRA